MAAAAAALLLCFVASCAAQLDPNGLPPRRDYYPLSPGDKNYRTYMFKDRRYGLASFPSRYDPRNPINRDPYNPQFDFGNDQNWDPTRFTNQHGPGGAPLPLPGLLGGWRPDLQGKERSDAVTLSRDRDVFVQTPYGRVQGFKVHLYDDPDPKSSYRPGRTPVERITGTAHVFLGIPYAMPPDGEGRFKPPRAHRGWQLIQAVDFGPACPQPFRYVGAKNGIRDMDEDCLYLNIYSPTTTAGLAQKYPTMIYIHGGEFQRGASNTFPAHILAVFYKVVVVTINYRLGALGFLSTGDYNSPGNYGILDQAMAVNWVYDNIDAFNGDRHSITLFGTGAGAASAGLLMVAPKTKERVSRVIAQSGSALADWALIKDIYRAQNTSRVFGMMLGCSIETSWKLVDCLYRGRSHGELGNAEFLPHVGLFPWGPVLDKNFTKPKDSWFQGWKQEDWNFMNSTPEYLIRKGQFNRGLSYLAGVTTQEAAFVLYENETLRAIKFDIDEHFVDQKIKEMVLRYNYTLNQRGVYEAIKYMYTYWPDPKNITHIREEYINMMSDHLFRAPNDDIIKLLVDENVPVYMYVLNTTVESLELPEWRKYPHDIEHYFLTGAPFMDVEFFPESAGLTRTMWTDNDRNMSHFFMKAFSDFAYYGNPSRTEILGLHFQMARHGHLHYLNINTTFNSSILMNYRQTECAFWTMYLPNVIGHLVPTYPPFVEWWEPRQPLQIAFWSVSTICLLLAALVVICCILWRNAKSSASQSEDLGNREQDRYYSGDLLMMRDESDMTGLAGGTAIENPGHQLSNMYEYRDQPSGQSEKVPAGKVQQTSAMMHTRTPSTSTAIPGQDSTPSVKTGSVSSLKDSVNGYPSGDSARTPQPVQRSAMPVPANRMKSAPSRTHLEGGVPQTQV